MARNEADFSWPGTTYQGIGIDSPESAINPDTTSDDLSSNLLYKGTSPFDVDDITTREILEIFSDQVEIARTILSQRFNSSQTKF